jgi:hypothetical protein
MTKLPAANKVLPKPLAGIVKGENNKTNDKIRNHNCRQRRC